MEVQELEIVKHLNKQNYAQSLECIVDAYHELLYWHIRKLVADHEDANDALQNTYIRIFKGLPNFKQQSSLKTWSYRIAYNEALRLLESKNKIKPDGFSAVSYLATLEADPYFKTEESEAKFLELLQTLKPVNREIFLMKYHDDLTFEEIAELKQINVNTVKTSYYNTRKWIESNVETLVE